MIPHLFFLFLTLTAAATDSDCLNKGGSLRAPASLVSGNNGIANLQVQEDGNLVVVQTNIHPSKVLWASGTSGSGNHLELQGDGNLVFYADSPSPHVLWASNTTSAAKLVMQSDCNLVLYTSANHVLWASNTACASGPPPAPTPGPGPSPGPPPAPTPGPGPSPGDKSYVHLNPIGCNS